MKVCPLSVLRFIPWKFRHLLEKYTVMYVGEGEWYQRCWSIQKKVIYWEKVMYERCMWDGEVCGRRRTISEMLVKVCKRRWYMERRERRQSMKENVKYVRGWSMWENVKYVRECEVCNRRQSMKEDVKYVKGWSMWEKEKYGRKC